MIACRTSGPLGFGYIKFYRKTRIMERPISGELAVKIFDILVQECEANEMGRDQFMQWATDIDFGPGKEYRFGGRFGMAGKIWLNYDGFHVSGYNHEELKLQPDAAELTAAIDTANAKLNELL